MKVGQLNNFRKEGKRKGYTAFRKEDFNIKAVSKTGEVIEGECETNETIRNLKLDYKDRRGLDMKLIIDLTGELSSTWEQGEFRVDLYINNKPFDYFIINVFEEKVILPLSKNSLDMFYSDSFDYNDSIDLIRKLELKIPKGYAKSFRYK